MLNIFDNDPAFSVVGMTALVNKQPFVPGLLGRMGIFDSAGVDTLTVAIEEQNGDLALVAPTPRGGPGETTDNEKRKIRDFRIPHYQRDDAITADEVQAVRAFGSEGGADAQRETIENKVGQKMQKHTRSLDATLEHQRCGALKGVIADKNGSVQYNLFTEYGITVPDLFEFDFASGAFKFRDMCSKVQRAIEDALDEDMMIEGIDAVCGPDYFDDAQNNNEYRTTYLNRDAADELQKSQRATMFTYGGIDFYRYRTGKRAAASAAAQTGNSPLGFIGPKEVRFIPRVPGLFLTRFAPADYEETVNTIGLPRYAKQWAKPNGKGREMEVQMNAMSWCTRPEALRGGFSG